MLKKWQTAPKIVRQRAPRDSKVENNSATADMEAKDEDNDTNQTCAQPLPQVDKEKPPVPDVEEGCDDKPDPEKSASP